jgi:hypothetical protein
LNFPKLPLSLKEKEILYGPQLLLLIWYSLWSCVEACSPVYGIMRGSGTFRR